MLRHALVPLLGAALFAAAAPVRAADSDHLPTLLESLEEAADYATLLAALRFAELDDALAEPGSTLTLFAPTDRAFARTLEGLGLTAAGLLTEANRELVEEILAYHLLPQLVPSAALLDLDGASAPTLQGDEIDVDVRRRLLVLNGDVRVTRPDNAASNGVFHGVSAVLLPPSRFGSRATLFDAIELQPTFSILTQALELTGLDADLEEAGAELTLLAPTDAAFVRTLSRLGLSLEALFAESNRSLLRDILLYHVVAGESREAAIRANARGRIVTLLGESIEIAARRGRLVLDGRVRVTLTDLDTTNGVYHVIDRVLLPDASGLAY